MKILASELKNQVQGFRDEALLELKVDEETSTITISVSEDREKDE